MQAASLDWSSARVYEKLDGSLFTLYWYGGSWQVQTSKLPAADGVLASVQKTFAELFWGVWDQQGNVLPAMAGDSDDEAAVEHGERVHHPSEPSVSAPNAGRCPQRHRCYMFELTTPDNVIIVRHHRKALVCIGARDLDTLEEISCEDIAEETGWATPRTFPQIRSLDVALAAAQDLNPVVRAHFATFSNNVIAFLWREECHMRGRIYLVLFANCK
jgi:hypothetical protein